MVWTHCFISSSISQLDSSVFNLPGSIIISLFRPTGWVSCKSLYSSLPTCINISTFKILIIQSQTLFEEIASTDVSALHIWHLSLESHIKSVSY